MSGPKISIIIVTWNGLHHLKQFLPSVWEHQSKQTEILIADNHSTDGTPEWVNEHYPGCRHIYLDENYGYAGGNNRAADYARGDLLLFLNNDAEVPPQWLEPLLIHFDRYPHTAALQPKIRDYRSPHMFEYAGAAGGFVDHYGYPFCRGRIFHTIERDRHQYDDICPIHWASGAAFAVRSSVFHRLGGFDERFEFHMEEIDLCWRIRNAGYHIDFTPEATVYHLGGGSLSSGSYRKWYYNYRNNLAMLYKNLPGMTAIRRISIRMLLDGLAGIYALLRANPSESLAILHAHFGFYHLLPSLARTKKEMLKSRSLPQDSKLKPFSIVWQYFIKRRKTFRELPDGSRVGDGAMRRGGDGERG